MSIAAQCSFALVVCTVVLAGCGGDPPTSSPDAVQTIYLTPSQATIDEGGSVQFQVLLRGADGSTRPAGTVSWGTSDAAVATVSFGGLVMGAHHGIAVISAATEGKIDFANVNVR